MSERLSLSKVQSSEWHCKVVVVSKIHVQIFISS
jgi:hypothetical protein